MCQLEPLDCLREHERWLGRSLNDCLGAPSQHADSNASASTARVRVTVNGLIGDCGWANPANYLFLRGPSLSRLTISDGAYEDYTSSRAIMRAVSHLTICERSDDFMSTFFGLDNSTVLPPFPPICRGCRPCICRRGGKVLASRSVCSSAIRACAPTGKATKVLAGRDREECGRSGPDHSALHSCADSS